MAEAGVISAAAAAATGADDKQLELHATAPLEEAEASSSKYIDLTTPRRRLEQLLPSSPKCSADEYVTARRRRLEQLRSECGSESEFEMGKSREHWTMVGEPSSSLDLVHVANRQHFQRLLQLSNSESTFIGLSKPSFFVEYSDGELVMGEKIGEGGQAEIFNATIHGLDEYVLKVFKPGFSLVDLECQWTIQTRDGHYLKEGVLGFYCCVIESGTLLKDGRFAFVIKRYWGDLRKLIDKNMLANNGLGPPFPPSQALEIIFMIALGMARLHEVGILHRDLKASNVLIENVAGLAYDQYVVADFESSGGAQGSRFWRAPEVLQVLKDKVKDSNVWKSIWSKKVDVYGYAMTSYEVLTGRIPFGDLKGNEYDVVLRGERPLLPPYVDPRIQELLRHCWHSDPSKRPTFNEIWSELLKFRMA